MFPPFSLIVVLYSDKRTVACRGQLTTNRRSGSRFIVSQLISLYTHVLIPISILFVLKCFFEVRIVACANK